MIGTRINKIIELSQLKKGEFAKKVGIDPSYIPKIVSGEKNPSDRVINDICDKIVITGRNINKDWLQTGRGEMFTDLSKEEYIAEFIGRVLKNKEDSFKKRYIAMLSKLDDDGWAALEKVAEAMGQLKKD